MHQNTHHQPLPEQRADKYPLPRLGSFRFSAIWFIKFTNAFLCANKAIIVRILLDMDFVFFGRGGFVIKAVLMLAWNNFHDAFRRLQNDEVNWSHLVIRKAPLERLRWEISRGNSPLLTEFPLSDLRHELVWMDFSPPKRSFQSSANFKPLKTTNL